jgi:hypothetical protein
MQRSLVHAELEKCREHAQKALETLLNYESQPLFTQNTHYLLNEEEKWRKHFNELYSDAHLHKRSADGGRRSRSSFTFPQTLQIDAKNAEPIHNEYAEELAVMARVQAYFRVAYKVCLTQ